MNVLRVALKIIIPALVGILAGGVTATIYFTAVNLHAGDGPYFPSAVLASVVVIPVAFVLLPFQFAMLAWCRVKGPTTLRGGLALGAIGGVVAGLTLAFVAFESSQHSIAHMFSFMAVGLVQSFATPVWLAYVTSADTLGRRAGARPEAAYSTIAPPNKTLNPTGNKPAK